jgi:hypothetical protein
MQDAAEEAAATTSSMPALDVETTPLGIEYGTEGDSCLHAGLQDQSRRSSACMHALTLVPSPMATTEGASVLGLMHRNIDAPRALINLCSAVEYNKDPEEKPNCWKR